MMVPEHFSVVADDAAFRPGEAGDDIEKGRLPGAVRPDEPNDFSSFCEHRHAVEGKEPSEFDAQFVDDEGAGVAAHGRARFIHQELTARCPLQVSTARPIRISPSPFGPAEKLAKWLRRVRSRTVRAGRSF